ncbi:unnamed protein product [Vitrella brassicaformis CCMP3155]|uniref:Protein kinase domain-containing protein n=1 Tax=Vitrella brassicaformis (strain CCMP3155) TaxID=1169540 RepID=A0A0G4H0F5_VITBC|nr:unnamed protein product [Vitrella brassicaformis CCMP3155]|eukprot:CEM36893.1 unnamed protein product [Vitrella brassicaformis CCMP3155]
MAANGALPDPLMAKLHLPRPHPSSLPTVADNEPLDVYMERCHLYAMAVDDMCSSSPRAFNRSWCGRRAAQRWRRSAGDAQDLLEDLEEVAQFRQRLLDEARHQGVRIVGRDEYRGCSEIAVLYDRPGVCEVLQVRDQGGNLKTMKWMKDDDLEPWQEPFQDSSWRRPMVWVTNEAINLSKLSHPNIIGCEGMMLNNGVTALFMPYIHGRSLDKMVTKHLPTSFYLHIAKQILSALAYMHSQQCVHRDIKPDNILVEDGTNKVYVIDFASAAFLNGSAGVELGAGFTKEYAPPEVRESANRSLLPPAQAGFPNVSQPPQQQQQQQQRRSPSVVDKSMDIFGVCVTLAELWVGEWFCIQGGGMKDTAFMPLSIPGPLGKLITQGLSSNPNERPTADELLKAAMRTKDRGLQVQRMWQQAEEEIEEADKEILDVRHKCGELKFRLEAIERGQHAALEELQGVVGGLRQELSEAKEAAQMAQEEANQFIQDKKDLAAECARLRARNGELLAANTALEEARQGFEKEANQAQGALLA